MVGIFRPSFLKRFFAVLFGMVFLFGLGYFFHPHILQPLADRLIITDQLRSADVILILAGDDNGERVVEGVRLYRTGWAKRLLMSGGPLAWRLTAAEWMKKQAVASGVPPAAVLIQDRSRSTLEDARFSLPLIKERGWRRVILVTSPYHTRRAKKIFEKSWRDEGIELIVVPAASQFEPRRWWSRHEDAARVGWEYASSVLYFFKRY
jgi:uncharacterized SAM-binding protein YcdF (DUF218 family)